MESDTVKKEKLFEWLLIATIKIHLSQRRKDNFTFVRSTGVRWMGKNLCVRTARLHSKGKQVKVFFYVFLFWVNW